MTSREFYHTLGVRTACGWRRTLGLTLGLLVLGMGTAMAQTFSSGSTGADGALDLSASPPGTVIEFDPTAFSSALDANGDSVYHFTTITIPADVTVRLRANKAGAAPLHWLATGAVVIDGTLDLNGEDGHSGLGASRLPSVPGPGGFAGGIGAGVPDLPPQAGFGPGRGCAGGGGAGHATSVDQNRFPCIEPTDGRGLSYGNAFLLPLIGGSGGGGFNNGYGGGAGGGAIMIASSVSIRVNGGIQANGGSSGGGSSGGGASGGSGGAIRLVAPTITGFGFLYAYGVGSSSSGRIRIEALQNTFIGQSIGVARATTLLPAPMLLPTGPLPQIRLVNVGGQVVPANPRGAFTPVDVTINTTQVVNIQLEGRNIPPGTPITITVANETEGSQVVSSSPLAGTAALSTATATVTMPAGFSRIFSHATW